MHHKPAQAARSRRARTSIGEEDDHEDTGEVEEPELFLRNESQIPAAKRAHAVAMATARGDNKGRKKKALKRLLLDGDSAKSDWSGK